MVRAIAFLFLIGIFSPEPVEALRAPAMRGSQAPRTNNHAINAGHVAQVAKAPWKRVLWAAGDGSFLQAGQFVKALLERERIGFKFVDHGQPIARGSVVIHENCFIEFLDRLRDKYAGIFNQLLKAVCNKHFMDRWPGRLIQIMSFLKKKDVLVFNELMEHVHDDFKLAVQMKDEQLFRAASTALPTSEADVFEMLLMREFDKLCKD